MTWLLLAGWLKRAWSVISAHPALAIAVLCAAYGAWEHHRAQGWVDYAHRLETSLKQADSASKAELARASAERDAAIQREKEANSATDHRIEAARASDRANLAQYVDRLRAAWGEGHSSTLPAAASSNVVQGGDRSGADPQLFQTLTSDLSICSENTRRLLEIHNQAVAPPTGQSTCSQGSGPSSSSNMGNC